MLNEGYALYKSLKHCGISLTNRHPDIKEPGNSEGLIVGIDKNGKVTRLEYRRAEEITKLWTIREGNHNSFPVVKLQEPLWKVDRSDPICDKKLDEHKKRGLLTNRNDKVNITSSLEKKWKKLLGRVNNLHPFFKTKDQDYVALYELANRFSCITDVSQFYEDLLKALKKSQSDISYSIYETMLLGKWDPKKDEYRAEVFLVFDVCDWESFPIRVASPKMEQFVSKCLFKMQSESIHFQDDSRSALSGRKVILENHKFPNPKLPVIGPTYLFAVNKNTPCQTRYGKTSTEIIPVGREEAIAIQNSLEWITKSERKEKTWSEVPSLSDGGNDLLIVYLENQPDSDVNNAYLLGGISENYISESTYESVASVAISALRGNKVIKASDRIKLFALQKADLGRKQISLQRAYTITELVRADKEWQEAARNIPTITIPFFQKEIQKRIKKVAAKNNRILTSISNFISDKNSEVIFLQPKCPFPADLVRISQKQWIRFGSDWRSAPGTSLGRVYDVFFVQQNGQISVTEELLRLTLQRTQALLIGLGGEEHKNKAGNLNDLARSTALLTTSALAIFLYKLGIRKDKYMQNTFFQVGRFLSLIDTLHLEYSKNGRIGRDGSTPPIPPRLLGNAHLQMALDDPVSAFDLISRRIGIYKAWAQKEQSAKGRLARWALGELGIISAMLAEKPLPTSTTSAERAQILLGYLAKSEGKSKFPTHESTQSSQGENHV